MWSLGRLLIDVGISLEIDWEWEETGYFVARRGAYLEQWAWHRLTHP